MAPFPLSDEWMEGLKSHLLWKGKNAMAKVDRAMGVDLNDFDRDTFLYIKRTCNNERCRNTPLDDPKGFMCGRCSDYKEYKDWPRGREAFKVMKTKMFLEKNRLDVFEYIRETCNNPKCFLASRKDKDAHVCDRCEDLRENQFEDLRIELELREDRALRGILCQKWNHPTDCKESHNIMPKVYKLIGTLSCRPCKCFVDWSVSKSESGSCPCGKNTSVYKGLREGYEAWRKVMTEHAQVVAIFQSKCNNSHRDKNGRTCTEVSEMKRTRFGHPYYEITDKCDCGRGLISRGLDDPKHKHYLTHKKDWDKEVSRWDEVVDFMKGSCKNEPCYFSRGEYTHDFKKPVYCLSCHDALEYDYDGIKRQLIESKAGEKYRPDAASLSLDFPPEFAENIGKNASKIAQLSEKFDVDIQLKDGFLEIKGSRAKAEAARGYINKTLHHNKKVTNVQQGGAKAKQIQAFDKLAREDSRQSVPHGGQQGAANAQQIRALDKIAKENRRNDVGQHREATARQALALDKLAREDRRNVSTGSQQDAANAKQIQAFDKLAREDRRNVSNGSQQSEANAQQIRAFDKLAKEDRRNETPGTQQGGAYAKQMQALDKLAREDGRNAPKRSQQGDANSKQIQALDKLAKENQRNATLGSQQDGAIGKQMQALDKLAKEDRRNAPLPPLPAEARQTVPGGFPDDDEEDEDPKARVPSRSSSSAIASGNQQSGAHAKQMQALDKLAKENQRNATLGSQRGGANAKQKQALDKIAMENRLNAPLPPLPAEARQLVPGAFPDDDEEDENPGAVVLSRSRDVTSRHQSVPFQSHHQSVPGGFPVDDEEEEEFVGTRSGRVLRLPHRGSASQHVPGSFADDDDPPDFPPPAYTP